MNEVKQRNGAALSVDVVKVGEWNRLEPPVRSKSDGEFGRNVKRVQAGLSRWRREEE